ncbi:GSCOCT00013808001.3-RA-CDS, partial [Cotesia congregata]
MKLSTESRGFRITPEKAVKFIKVSVYLTCMWPPQGDESKISFKFRKYLSVFLSFGLFFPLLFSIVIYFNDMLIILKSAICMTALVNYISKVIIVTRYHREFEKFRSVLNEFILKASDSSKVVFQKYVDKFWKFQFFMVFCYYFGATGIIMGPLVLPQKFPTDAVYPFSVENPVVAGIIYAHQGFAAYLGAAGMVLDGQ